MLEDKIVSGKVYICLNNGKTLMDSILKGTGKPHITYTRIATPSYKGQKSRYNDNSSYNLI